MSTISRSLTIVARALNRIVGFAGLIAVLIVLKARQGAQQGAVTRGDSR